MLGELLSPWSPYTLLRNTKLLCLKKGCHTKKKNTQCWGFMKEISFQLILANKLFLIPKCWFQTTGLFLDTRVSTGRNRIESNMQEVLLNQMLPLNYRDVPWYRSVSTGRNKSKATSGKKKSENMSLGIIIFVPLEFRLSQRGAYSATPSSFTILAEYDLENQLLIDLLRLFRCRHKQLLFPNIIFVILKLMKLKNWNFVFSLSVAFKLQGLSAIFRAAAST